MVEMETTGYKIKGLRRDDEKQEVKQGDERNGNKYRWGLEGMEGNENNMLDKQSMMWSPASPYDSFEISTIWNWKAKAKSLKFLKHSHKVPSANIFYDIYHSITQKIN